MNSYLIFLELNQAFNTAVKSGKREHSFLCKDVNFV